MEIARCFETTVARVLEANLDIDNPVIISNEKTNGFKDIIMFVSGSGIESFYARLQYNGKRYPLNPSIQPRVSPGNRISGKAIIADDIAINPGIEL